MSIFKKTIRLSTETSVTVHGYEIKRAPVGKFISALQVLETVPIDMVKVVFETANLQDVLAGLKDLNQERLMALIVKALTVLPNKVIEVFAELAELDKEKLLNDAELGISGLMDLITKWVEINGIVNFTRGVTGLIETAKKARNSQRPSTGSNA